MERGGGDGTDDKIRKCAFRPSKIVSKCSKKPSKPSEKYSNAPTIIAGAFFMSYFCNVNNAGWCR